MDRHEIEEVRAKVSCAAVLTNAGFRLDAGESSRRALKFRRGTEIVVVTHGGSGWFDPLSERKGDVFALAGLLDHVAFADAVARVSVLAGLSVMPVSLKRSPRSSRSSVLDRWQGRPVLTLQGAGYRYLVEARGLLPPILRVIKH